MSKVPSYFAGVRDRALKELNRRKESRQHHNLFKRAFDEVRKSPFHVISELLQNADDAGATTAQIDITDESLRFSHNGRDFTAADFESICQLGVSSKPVMSTIGFMGVGSKSVYAVGDSVTLVSDSLQVTFNIDSPDCPEWLPSTPAGGRRPGWTTFTVPFRSAATRDRVVESASNWNESPYSLAFFRNLTTLEIDGSTWRISRKGEPIHGSIATLENNGNHIELLHLRSAREKLPTDCVDELRELRDFLPDVDIPEVAVDVVSASEVNGSVFIVLSTKMGLPIPFAFNGPFIPSGNRDWILDPEDSPTNRHLLSMVGRLIGRYVLDRSSNKKLTLEERGDAYDLLPGLPEETSDELDVHCQEVILEAIREELASKSFLLCSDGAMRAPGAVARIPRPLLGVWKPGDVKPGGKNILAMHISESASDTLCELEWVEDISDDRIRSWLLGDSMVPVPKNAHGLHELWSYCEKLTQGYAFSSKADSLRAFPDTKGETLHAASSICRFPGELLEKSGDLRDFAQKYLVLMDEDLLDTESCQSCRSDIRKASSEFLKRSGIKDDTSEEKIIRSCWSSIKNSNAEDDNYRLFQLARTLNAELPENFLFLCRDGEYRTADEGLVDLPLDLPQNYYPADFLGTHAISEEYWRSPRSKDDTDWAPLPRLLPPDKVTRSVRDGNAEIRRRGATGECHNKYRDKYVYDIDFDDDVVEYWSKEVSEGRLTWIDIVKPMILHQAPDLQNQIFATMAISTVSNFAAEWIVRLRTKPCLLALDGDSYVPAALYGRSSATEALLNFAPFVAAELECQASQPILSALGVRYTSPDLATIHRRIQEISHRESDAELQEGIALLRALDHLLRTFSPEQQGESLRLFAGCPILPSTQGKWLQPSQLCLLPQEDERVAIVHIDVRNLPLVKLLGVPSNIPVDDEHWYEKYQLGHPVRSKDKKRLRKHVSHAWRMLGRWYDLDGIWRSTADFQFRLYDDAYSKAIEVKNLLSEICSATADFRGLTPDDHEGLDLTDVSNLADVAAREVIGAPPGQPGVHADWVRLVARIAKLMANEQNEGPQADALHEVCSRLYASTFILCPGGRVQWKVGEDSISEPIPLDAYWSGRSIYVAGRCQDDLLHKADAVVREISGPLADLSDITAGQIMFCVARSERDILRFFKDHFSPHDLPEFKEEDDPSATNAEGPEAEADEAGVVELADNRDGEGADRPEAKSDGPPRPSSPPSAPTEPGHGSSRPWDPTPRSNRSPIDRQTRMRSYVRRFGDDEDEADGKKTELGMEAERFVVNAEEAAGRTPRAMPTNHKGYDIESVNADGSIRYIEVKGLSGCWGVRGVGITRAQFEMAVQKGANWWLYVVENVGSGNPIIHPVQNPFMRVNEFRFDDGWKGEPECDNKELPRPAGNHPEEGVKYRTQSGEVVEIEAVIPRGSLTEVRVVKSDGSRLPVPWNNRWVKV